MNNTIAPHASIAASEDSGKALRSTWVGRGKHNEKALSEPLRAAVEALAPLYVLGATLFERLVKECFRSQEVRLSASRGGLVWIPGRPFMFRDEKARAWYIYQCINDLTYPCEKSQPEKDQLKARFEAGWSDGTFLYLAAVPFEEIAKHKETKKTGNCLVRVAPDSPLQ